MRLNGGRFSYPGIRSWLYIPKRRLRKQALADVARFLEITVEAAAELQGKRYTKAIAAAKARQMGDVAKAGTDRDWMTTASKKFGTTKQSVQQAHVLLTRDPTAIDAVLANRATLYGAYYALRVRERERKIEADKPRELNQSAEAPDHAVTRAQVLK
jgi:plasmid stabilization system protein ParE